MRRSSSALTFLVCASALAVAGCGQQASTPTATGTPIGAAASDAEAQAAATAKAAELAAKEQELAEREASLKAQEAEKAKRLKDFSGFQIDEALLSKAPDHAAVLHCLPAYRGLEISAAVFEGPRSLVFAEAENRLHFQKGLLAVLSRDGPVASGTEEEPWS